MTKKVFFNQYNRPIQCKECGGAMEFKGVGEYHCEDCGAIEFDDYGVVRNYIEEHRGATVAEISFATGVSQREINEMVKEERFEVSADSRTFLKCEGCGIQIRSGRYCPTCLRLAEAAEARKLHEEEMKQRKLSGVAMGEMETAVGERRFKREEE